MLPNLLFLGDVVDLMSSSWSAAPPAQQYVANPHRRPAHTSASRDASADLDLFVLLTEVVFRSACAFEEDKLIVKKQTI